MSAQTDEGVIPIEDRPLYKLLVRGFPTYLKKRGNGIVRLDIRGISSDIGYAYQGVYKRFLPTATRNSISVHMARKLIELSEKQEEVPANFTPLSMVDFEPYLI